MLAHLQYFDLSSLLEDFDVSHVAFLHLFDRYFALVFLVEGKLHETKLTFAKSLIKFIEL
jgi:hypothetical protein